MTFKLKLQANADILLHELQPELVHLDLNENQTLISGHPHDINFHIFLILKATFP